MIDDQLIYGFKPPQSPYNPPPFVHYAGADALLSPPECEAIIAAGRPGLKPGGVGGGGDEFVDGKIRKAMQSSIMYSDFPWLYDRLAQRAIWTNQNAYGFDLSGLNELIQFLEYTPAEDEDDQDGHYRWHQDVGPGYTSLRKLSIVVQLTDPTEYEGCRLKLFDCQSPELEVPYIGQGEAVIFPSWVPHMVTPIESGLRNALALWVSGPPFR